MAFSVEQKFAVSPCIFGASLPVGGVCLFKVARAFTPHAIKVRFCLAMADCLLGVIFGLAFYWYRSRLFEPYSGEAEVRTLANVSITPAHLPDEANRAKPSIDPPPTTSKDR